MSTGGKSTRPEFSYAFDSLKNAAVVSLRGRASFDHMPEFEKCFKAVGALNDRLIVLELTELSYIGSAGLGAFVTLKHAVDARGGRIVLVSSNPLINDLFETAGFQKLFTIVSTLEEATR